MNALARALLGPGRWLVAILVWSAAHLSLCSVCRENFCKAYAALNDLATLVLSSEPSGMRAGWNENSKHARERAKANFAGGKV